MDIPTTHEILLFRLMLCAIILFFDTTYAITLFIGSFFVCQTYTAIILELRLFETEKESFQEIVQLVVIFFVLEFIVFVVVCISLLWRSCLESPIYTTIVIVVKHVFKRNHTCLTQLLNFFLLLFLSCTPNLSWTGEHLLWCIHITETYHCWGWKICA